MGRHKSNLEDNLLAERRMIVSSLLSRGFTYRGIVKALAEKGYVNPETHEPFVLNTIAKDAAVVKKEWHENAQKSVQQWREEQLADIDELVRTAYAKGKLDTVRGALDLKVKLTGTAEAEKIDLSIGPTKTYVVISPEDWPEK